MFNGIGDNGEVKNLQLVDVDYDVKQGGASGGIAWSNYGTITACSVTGTIAAANGGVGGIATSNIGTITACWFKGSITGYRFAGGIAAFNYNDVSACYWNVSRREYPLVQTKPRRSTTATPGSQPSMA